MSKFAVTVSVWFTLEDQDPTYCSEHDSADELQRALRRMSPEGRLEYLRAMGACQDGNAVHVAPVLESELQPV